MNPWITTSQALPRQTSPLFPPPLHASAGKEEAPRRPKPLPSPQGGAPARRGKGPTLLERKGQPARTPNRARTPPPNTHTHTGARGTPPPQVSCHLRTAPPGRARPAGWQSAEFADSKARRRRRAHTSAHERSPALPAHVAVPRRASPPAVRVRPAACRAQPRWGRGAVGPWGPELPAGPALPPAAD